MTLRAIAPITGYELYLMNKVRPLVIVDSDGHLWYRRPCGYVIHDGQTREVSQFWIDSHFGVWDVVYG